MLRTFLMMMVAATEAFMLTGVKRAPMLARTSAPQAMVADTALTTVSTNIADIPSSMLVADNLLLASGGLIFAIFLFAVVGTVVINFGIMKKK